MTSVYLNNTILIAFLKEKRIKKIVLSSGARNIPFVSTVETDPYFECFSVVDERNAAFFALGLAQQCQEPVALACTSGTAVSNYLSGMTEAYYSHVPLVAITFDRSPYALGQMETQKIDQIAALSSATKMSVSLPIIKDDEDRWYCERLLSEAFIAMRRHGEGPVHINVPLVGDMNALYGQLSLRENEAVKCITYLSADDEQAWESMRPLLSSAKRILLIMGQTLPPNNRFKEAIGRFCALMRCPLLADNLANVHCPEMVLAGPVIKALDADTFEVVKPDLVITLGANFQERIKDLLKAHAGEFAHWSIEPEGVVKDVFKSQTALFECAAERFFMYWISHCEGLENASSTYLETWRKLSSAIVLPAMPFTNFSVARELAKALPRDSILHLSILNSTRLMQFYELDDSITVYSNVNSFGIDGCLPAFMGQAAATDKLAFLMIGDLSFFYAMNALGIKHRGRNIRVLVVNNGGGAEFHIQPDDNAIPTIDLHIGAAHDRTARGWAESLDYTYLSARDEETFASSLEAFVKSESDKPILLEAFTDMKRDGEFCLSVYRSAEQCIRPLLDQGRDA